MKTYTFWIVFLLTAFRSVTSLAYTSGFDIDEVITAIKNDIKTADISELGNPRFSIETVDVALTVFSTQTEKGALAVRIAGCNDTFDDVLLPMGSYQNLSFSFKPTGSADFSPNISLGLVEPIRKVKSSLKKACNTPPSFRMDKFKFKFEFAIEQNMDGGIQFRILELDDLKAQHIPTHRVTVHLKIAN